MKNYFCQQINKFDTWRKQRPVLSFLLIFTICFLLIFLSIYLAFFRNNYKTFLGLGWSGTTLSSIILLWRLVEKFIW